MKENMSKTRCFSSLSTVFSRYSIFMIIIFGSSLLIRFYFFPLDVPLNSDSLLYFWYSSDIYQTGELPKNWTPINNGWPILVSLFFKLFNTNDIFTLMSIQRLLSTVFSVLISVPVYFLCKKFVPKKFAIIGATLIVFDPRLMVNSFIGVTDPLYLFLISLSLLLFFSSSKKIVYLAFCIVGLSTIVRGEGIVFFVVLSIMFFIKYKKEHFGIPKYLVVLGIFLLIVLPFSYYRIETTGMDGIFMRGISSGEELISSSQHIENSSVDNFNNKFLNGFGLFIKYILWVVIPNFIIFIPLGIILIFKNRNFEKTTLIFYLGLMSVPAIYAYTVPAFDTRYLYILFPIFAILSALSIEKILERFQKKNFFIILIILGMIISSIIFYDYLKTDFEHERESFEIMQKISNIIGGSNVLYPESSYITTSQTIQQWPSLYSNLVFTKKIIPIENDISLKDYILKSKEIGLTHIIVDNNENRLDSLKELFLNENKYEFLEKVYDSKEEGFNYQVKVFEIKYEIMD